MPRSALAPCRARIVVKADVQGSLEAIQSALLKLNDDSQEVPSASRMPAPARFRIGRESGVRDTQHHHRLQCSAGRGRQTRRRHRGHRYSLLHHHLQPARRGKGGDARHARSHLRGCYRRLRRSPRSLQAARRRVVAGLYVLDGRVTRNSRARVLRDGKVVHEGAIKSLKRFKEDAREVATGYECGLGLDSFNDIQVRDQMEFFHRQEDCAHLARTTHPSHACLRDRPGARTMTRRTRQVGELLREELTDIIRTDVKDPRVGFFTITRVDIGPDLRNATAMVSVLGSEKEREETLEALRSAAGYIRRQLKPRLRIGRCRKSRLPMRSMEHAQEIAAALKELERERAAARATRNQSRGLRVSSDGWQVDVAAAEDALSTLLSANSVCFPTHQNVDADGLSSALALLEGLRRKGGNGFVLISDGKFPRYLSFLPGRNRVIYGKDELPDYDMLCLVDCSDQRRLGKFYTDDPPESMATRRSSTSITMSRTTDTASSNRRAARGSGGGNRDRHSRESGASSSMSRSRNLPCRHLRRYPRIAHRQHHRPHDAHRRRSGGCRRGSSAIVDASFGSNPRRPFVSGLERSRGFPGKARCSGQRCPVSSWPIATLTRPRRRTWSTF